MNFLLRFRRQVRGPRDHGTRVISRTYGRWNGALHTTLRESIHRIKKLRLGRAEERSKLLVCPLRYCPTVALGRRGSTLAFFTPPLFDSKFSVGILTRPSPEVLAASTRALPNGRSWACSCASGLDTCIFHVSLLNFQVLRRSSDKATPRGFGRLHKCTTWWSSLDRLACVGAGR